MNNKRSTEWNLDFSKKKRTSILGTGEKPTSTKRAYLNRAKDESEYSLDDPLFMQNKDNIYSKLGKNQKFESEKKALEEKNVLAKEQKNELWQKGKNERKQSNFELTDHKIGFERKDSTSLQNLNAITDRFKKSEERLSIVRKKENKLYESQQFWKIDQTKDLFQENLKRDKTDALGSKAGARNQYGFLRQQKSAERKIDSDFSDNEEAPNSTKVGGNNSDFRMGFVDKCKRKAEYGNKEESKGRTETGFAKGRVNGFKGPGYEDKLGRMQSELASGVQISKPRIGLFRKHKFN